MRCSGTMLGVECCRFSGEFIIIHPPRLFPVYVKSVPGSPSWGRWFFCHFQKQREDQTGTQWLEKNTGPNTRPWGTPVSRTGDVTWSYQCRHSVVPGLKSIIHKPGEESRCSSESDIIKTKKKQNTRGWKMLKHSARKEHRSSPEKVPIHSLVSAQAPLNKMKSFSSISA